MVEVYSMKGLWLWHKHMLSKLWLDYENSKMKGLMFRRWSWLNDGAYDVIQNYNRVGFDLNNSSGYGGELNEPWEAWAECLKHYVGLDVIHLGFMEVEMVISLLVRDSLLKLRNQ